MIAADRRRSSAPRAPSIALACLGLLLAGVTDTHAVLAAAAPQQTAVDRQSAPKPSPSARPVLPNIAGGALRILLVDDDYSDNNNLPGDKRQSPSDAVFRKLVSDAVGGGKAAWSIEVVKSNDNGPSVDRLRPYSLVLWYTGASYGGNPDNTSVLSIEDEKTVRRYLEESGGTFVLVSPGYLSKVLEQGSGWEQTSWPFLKEVMGVRGGRGLAQRFAPGIVTTPAGDRFQVGKGGIVESQFSAINPSSADVLFTADLEGMTHSVPVATVSSYGKGRFVYIGFTFENLVPKDVEPAFGRILAAGGHASVSATAPCTEPTSASSGTAMSGGGPATVEVSGTPTTAVVSWTLPTATILNASLVAPQVAKSVRTSPSTAARSVRVERLAQNARPSLLNVVPPDAQKADDPGPLTPGQTLTYRVTLLDGCNVVGVKEATYTPSLPRDPTGLTATTAADGSVSLAWQSVDDPAVAGYQITGTSLAAPVVVRYKKQWTSVPQPVGTQRWSVATIYAPGGVLTSSGAWPSVTSRRSPAPGIPFLSLPNGVGSIAESTAYYEKECEPFSSSCPGAEWFLWASSEWNSVWSTLFGYNEDPFVPPQWAALGFSDLINFGLGRRVNCVKPIDARFKGTMCWATSHGHIPAANESPDGAALATAGEQITAIKSLSIIVISEQGQFFGSWEPDGSVADALDIPIAREFAFVKVSGKRYLTAMDSQGPKSVPNACLSCHGGRYDAVRKVVVGASLQPLIPANLVFSSPQARAKTEEDLRRINKLVLDSNPSPAIRAQITALYNGSPSVPLTHANDAAVPPGWSSQPGLYQQVIAPYCGSCHFAQTGSLSFITYGDLVANKDRVQKAVCADFSMPHSEQSFRRFWSEGGAVSLPGMLSATLGFPKCPQ